MQTITVMYVAIDGQPCHDHGHATGGERIGIGSRVHTASGYHRAVRDRGFRGVRSVDGIGTDDDGAALVWVNCPSCFADGAR